MKDRTERESITWTRVSESIEKRHVDTEHPVVYWIFGLVVLALVVVVGGVLL